MDKKKYKFGIQRKTMMYIAFPCIMICLFTCFYAIFSYRNVIRDEVKEKLHTAAYGATIVSENLGTNTELMLEEINKYADEVQVEITIYGQNKVVVSSIEGTEDTLIDQRVKKEIVEQNQSIFYTDAHINGQEYYGYYIPWVDEGDLTGAVFAGITKDEAVHLIFVKVRNLVFSIVGITLFFLIFSSFRLKKLMKKLDIAFDYTENLGNNQLSLGANILNGQNRDEYEGIANKIYEVAGNLKGIVFDIKEISNKSSDISKELSSNSEIANQTTSEISNAMYNITDGAQSQANDTEKMAESVQQMGDSIETIVSESDLLFRTAGEMSQSKDDSMIALDVLSKTNQDIMNDISNVNEQVQITTGNINAISKALNVIQEIASQTNLLSLNASIEAARAGEAGKGFAVVAGEIRTLADQSNESSREIAGNLNNLLENYNLIVKKMDATTKNVEEQNQKLGETEVNFKFLSSGIERVSSKIEEIKALVENIDNQREVINEAVMNLSAISQENAASSQEVMASIEELNSVIILVDNMASELKDINYKLNEDISIFSVD